METLLQVTASWILPALFFWFLFSLIAMVILEFIQRVRKSRQKGLEEVLVKLMGVELTGRFYKHALVNPLENAKPAYISQTLFAKVVMDWIVPKNPVTPAGKQTPEKNDVHKSVLNNIQSLANSNQEFADVLQTIAVQADMRTDTLSAYLDIVQHDLEAWFSSAVNQMTPVYGSRLQNWTLGVSFLVAFVANFDVISITSRLWITSKYKEVLDIAEITKQPYDLPNLDLITMLPAGWYIEYLPKSGLEWLLKLIGIGLGALLIAVGSQYAFNLTRRPYKPSK